MPITKVHVCSATDTAKDFVWQAQDTTQTISITITSPYMNHLKFANRDSDSVLALKFEDTEYIKTSDTPFSEDIAKTIKEFVLRWHDKPDNILLVVNCQMGWSRSPAVGKVVAEKLGIPCRFFEKAVMPNLLVTKILNSIW